MSDVIGSCSSTQHFSWSVSIGQTHPSFSHQPVSSACCITANLLVAWKHSQFTGAHYFSTGQLHIQANMQIHNQHGAQTSSSSICLNSFTPTDTLKDKSLCVSCLVSSPQSLKWESLFQLPVFTSPPPSSLLPPPSSSLVSSLLPRLLPPPSSPPFSLLPPP
ncbi:unnamed protein product [Pleuronectes platessa]|uniref:Uncharacterized protein n=1 Tax=Pleuronectes platessa TaxID=8262 RepID=A0A9N7TXJ6_PLEPL|nr:unnamed protein product [Pleuronectes platessa]